MFFDFVNRFMKLGREKMPQVKDPYELQVALSTVGIKTSFQTVNPKDLKASQEEIDLAKCDKMSKSAPEIAKIPIVVSSDFFVIDGHHRWWVLKNILGAPSVKALVVDLPLRDAVREVSALESAAYN